MTDQTKLLRVNRTCKSHNRESLVLTLTAPLTIKNNPKLTYFYLLLKSLPRKTIFEIDLLELNDERS